MTLALLTRKPLAKYGLFWRSLSTDPFWFFLVHPSLAQLTADRISVSIETRTSHSVSKDNEFLVSKETVVLRQWERSKQKFGFIRRVDKG